MVPGSEPRSLADLTVRQGPKDALQTTPGRQVQATAPDQGARVVAATPDATRTTGNSVPDPKTEAAPARNPVQDKPASTGVPFVSQVTPKPNQFLTRRVAPQGIEMPLVKSHEQAIRPPDMPAGSVAQNTGKTAGFAAAPEAVDDAALAARQGKSPPASRGDQPTHQAGYSNADGFSAGPSQSRQIPQPNDGMTAPPQWISRATVPAQGADASSPSKDRLRADSLQPEGLTSVELRGAGDISSKPLRAATALPHQSAEAARQVAVQISTAARTGREGSTEIALNPAELGRVRITMVPGDAGMLVTVSAERPDTLDLMRRHIDLLAQEFRDIGYGGTAFSFGQHDNSGDGASNDRQGAVNNSADFAEMETLQAEVYAPSTRIVAKDRVDIRL